MNAVDRFWAKVDKGNGDACWLWTGAKSKGYGLVRIDGVARRAHRVAYEWANGPIPEGMELDHFACDTPSCVNPSHSRPVTHRENVLRGRAGAAWNLTKTHCPQGHELSNDNITRYSATRSFRQCRLCKNAAELARYYARRKLGIPRVR